MKHLSTHSIDSDILKQKSVHIMKDSLPGLEVLYSMTYEVDALELCFSKPWVAVVGSRAANRAGLEMAYNLSKELALNGITVVSGLALGVDAAAHRGALDSRAKSSTVAILGHGLDMLYPAKHKNLSEDILNADGALLSSYQVGTPPLRHHFLQRNGLIAALSEIVCVVQAKVRSGALNTAHQALNLGKDVVAVPGSHEEGLHDGCHELIRQGAGIIWKVEHILELLSFAPASPREQETALATRKTQIRSLLDQVASLDQASVQNLALHTKRAESELRMELMELELAGKIRILADDRIVVRGLS